MSLPPACLPPIAHYPTPAGSSYSIQLPDEPALHSPEAASLHCQKHTSIRTASQLKVS